MKTPYLRKRYSFIGFLTLISTAGCTISTEQAQYTVIEENGEFEIRNYPSQLLAQTLATGTQEDASNKAFRKLFKFITGENKANTEIAMTAPVSQQKAGVKINMTTPVSLKKTDEKYLVSFTMPSEYTLKTLPIPTNQDVVIAEIPPRKMAAIRYSGNWSSDRYEEHKGKLKEWLQTTEYKIIGDPVWARYNPPFTPSFMRRNEVLFPIE